MLSRKHWSAKHGFWPNVRESRHPMADVKALARERVCGVDAPIDSADLFATSACDGPEISIWSLAERRRISRFETVYTRYTSGYTLIAVERPLLLLGNWERYGVSAYDAISGELLWRRKDLKRVGVVGLMNDGLTVAVSPSERPMTMLSILSGETVARLRATRDIVPSIYGSYALHIGTRQCLLRSFPDGAPLWPQPLNDMSILSTAMGPDSILLSRGWIDWDDGTPYIDRRHNPVRCIGLDGTFRWDWQPAPACQLNAMAWSEGHHCWFGLEWSWRDGGPFCLVQLSADGQLLGRSGPTNIHRAAFMDRGNLLVSAEGAVLSLPDCTPVWTFAPDPPALQSQPTASA